MRILLAALAVGFLVLPSPAAAQDDPAAARLRIEWTEFKKLHDAKKVVVVDVRDAEAFEAARIPDSINVPLDQVEKRVAELRKHGKPVVFYCA
jgi:rhodanese-related sulfurtransferase